jgi:hypothetical protein
LAYKDDLYTMQEGCVSKPMQKDKTKFYLYLDHIEDISVNPREEGNLLTELQIGTEQEIIEKDYAEMRKALRVNLNLPSVNLIGDFLAQGHDLGLFKEDLELATYYIDDKPRVLTFNLFLEYITHQFIKRDIREKEALIFFINDYCGDDYLVNEAKKIDLYHSDVFLLDQKNYQNNVLYSNYIDKEISQYIQIDSLDVKAWYGTHLDQFEQPRTITVNAYYFNSKEAALGNQAQINSLLNQKEISKTQDSAIIKGLINFEPGLSLDMDLSGKNTEWKEAIRLARPGSLIDQPVVYDGHFALFFYEKADGKCTQKLAEVSGYIEYTLKNEQIEKLRQVRIHKLKEKYKVEIDKTGI